MKIEFSDILLGAALIGILSGFIYLKVLNRSYNNTLTEWQNRVARMKDTIQETKNISSNLATRNKKIKSKNKELQKIINDKNEKIKSQTKITAELKDSINNISTTPDTIIVEDTTEVPVRKFYITKNPFTVSGYFLTQPPFTLSIKQISASIEATSTITESKNGTFSTYIESKTSSLTIKNIETQFVPYTPSFWEKIKIGLGGYVANKQAGLFTQFGYSSFTALTGYTTTGWMIGGSYWIK